MTGKPLLPNKLSCPICGGDLSNVQDSRPESRYGFNVVARRRRCSDCDQHSVTYEFTKSDLFNLTKALEASRQKRIAELKAEIAALEEAPDA